MNKYLIPIGLGILIVGPLLLSYLYLGGFPVGFLNGRLVIYAYFCSDVCPQQGFWHKRYYGIRDAASCEAVGGRAYIDPAWGGLVGCFPE